MNTRTHAGVGLLLAVVACGCGEDGGANGSAGTCDADVLRTGLVAQQTGVSVDAFDCAILEAVSKHHEPDPMIIKAIIYAESRFDHLAVGCANMPCGQPEGWTSEESGCLGLMQVVVACGGPTMEPVLLSDGHPNMSTDPASNVWSGSVFNPAVNIDLGVAALAGNRAQAIESFPGCTVDQYTLMALGNYASYGSTKGCTTYNTDYIDLILPTYRQYAEAAGYAAHPY